MHYQERETARTEDTERRLGDARLFGWRRLLLGALAALLLAFLIFSEAAHATLLRILDGVNSIAAVHAGLAALVVVLFSALAAMVAFISSWLVVPLAVHTWGTLGGLLLVWGGWVLGGAVSYVIGYRFGAPAARWLGFSPQLARYQEWVSHRTPFALAFLFQLALPSEIRGLLFGLGRYRFGRYLLSFALAELPFGVGTVYLGRGIVERRGMMVAVMFLGLALLSVWAFRALHRRLAAMHEVFERERRVAARDAVTPGR